MRISGHGRDVRASRHWFGSPRQRTECRHSVKSALCWRPCLKGSAIVKMDKLGDWLQIIGLFGVIGSLIFVGLQLKQTQAIALSETY